MKKINSRSGILPGAIIMVALFFIFDKLNANRDFYIITLGLVTVIVEFFTSLICDYNRKINKFFIFLHLYESLTNLLRQIINIFGK